MGLVHLVSHGAPFHFSYLCVYGYAILAYQNAWAFVTPTRKIVHKAKRKIVQFIQYIFRRINLDFGDRDVAVGLFVKQTDLKQTKWALRHQNQTFVSIMPHAYGRQHRFFIKKVWKKLPFLSWESR